MGPQQQDTWQHSEGWVLSTVVSVRLAAQLHNGESLVALMTAPIEPPSLLEVLRARLDADQPWRRDALCREHPDLPWVPALGQAVDAAKAVCRRCAVRDECLGYALHDSTLVGVWGATTARERAVIRAGDEGRASWVGHAQLVPVRSHAAQSAKS